MEKTLTIEQIENWLSSIDSYGQSDGYWIPTRESLVKLCALATAQLQGQEVVEREIIEKLEEIISAIDRGLGDTDITHLETDEEIREQAPIQWACTQLSLLTRALSSPVEREIIEKCAKVICNKCASNHDIWKEPFSSPRWRHPSGPCEASHIHDLKPEQAALSPGQAAERGESNVGGQTQVNSGERDLSITHPQATGESRQAGCESAAPAPTRAPVETGGEPLAYAVKCDMTGGSEFDFMIYPEREEAEEAIRNREDEPEIIPLYALRSSTDGTAREGVMVPREFLERMRPAANTHLIRAGQALLKIDKGEFPPHYRLVLERDADRAKALVDEIDALLATPSDRGGDERDGRGKP